MSVEMELVGVKIQMPTNSPVLVLRELDGLRRVVPIFIGSTEARAIDLAMSDAEPPRPMTHDLFVDVMDGLGATLESVVIDDIRDGTFFANLLLVDSGGDSYVFSARPSDAIALALRTDSPILAEETVLEEAGIIESEQLSDKGEEEIVLELRKFLDKVNPEDFQP
jgi:bifunctional DNase/RNase